MYGRCSCEIETAVKRENENEGDSSAAQETPIAKKSSKKNSSKSSSSSSSKKKPLTMWEALMKVDVSLTKSEAKRIAKSQ